MNRNISSYKHVRIEINIMFLHFCRLIHGVSFKCFVIITQAQISSDFIPDHLNLSVYYSTIKHSKLRSRS